MWNPESWKFLPMKSVFLGLGIQNTAVGIWDPTKIWNLESKKVPLEKMWSPLTGIWNPQQIESIIQDCLGFPYMG